MVLTTEFTHRNVLAIYIYITENIRFAVVKSAHNTSLNIHICIFGFSKYTKLDAAQEKYRAPYRAKQMSD